ncbi:STAS/SEC14 domain-containing protein [Alteribacter populi]|uniref:STAS/SEC14 domain-containing protein n=1 Tax=Alteribacter populi TaxID=2011011 RepID=UPI000BBB3ACA|nr:STAS/SEC14 domain-containing protein [Alteribacter populi]
MIRKLDSSKGNVLEYEVKSKMTKEENDQLMVEVSAAIERFGEVRLLVRLWDMPGVEFSAIDDRLKFAKDHLIDIERYALVSDSNLAEYLAEVTDTVTGIDLRHFRMEEEAEARAWVHE